MKTEIRSLPKLADLYNEVELASKFNELNRILNSNPKPEWIKVNPFANGSRYIPVGTVEYLLTSIYIKWRLEVKSLTIIANSVVATIRLYVLDPVSNEWDWQDGVGASPIQTAKGAAATDFTQVNTAAVQMAAPSAESYAFKDAAEKFGKIFGKDLNRKDEMNYQTLDGKFDTPVVVQKNEAVNTDISETVKIIIQNIKSKKTVRDIDLYLYTLERKYLNVKAIANYVMDRKMEIMMNQDVDHNEDDKLDRQNEVINEFVERDREREYD